MIIDNDDHKNWASYGKTIGQLISELESFGDRDLVVEISVDGGASSFPISLVGKLDEKCLLISID